ncbi:MULTISPECIES: fimbrial protein [Enterobacter]|uniref:fimbrial protein n=1 Tax=Enterobacter TaxID=547 RepID=UPI0008EDAD57|nr:MULTISPECIES: fimbrial protein [Enterobacter]WJW86758.1 fimbrial protein [Enterobacter pseudoroggenkampii]WJW95434.1 fimbrial protein [Enterobacter pseudoroggenkampii]SFI38206.1 Pilin (type 1 fimbria component protein) [Enterobacter sp. NFIX59]
MKKTSLCAVVLLALSAQAMAGSTSLDVTFTATLRETTCDMAIEGGTGDGQKNTIPIGAAGKTSLADISSGADTASTTFKLKIIECPSSLAGLKTTIAGSQSANMVTAIANTASVTPAANMGVSIARVSAPTAPFTINSTVDAERLVWTGGEISGQEVPLIARLVETKAGEATTGSFSAIATFNFEYQ